MTMTDQTATEPQDRPRRNRDKAASEALAVQIEATKFAVSLGSRQGRSGWNSTVDVDLADFPPAVIQLFLRKGASLVLRDSTSEAETEADALEMAAKRYTSLREGVTELRRTAATATERRALQLAETQLRNAMRQRGEKIPDKGFAPIVREFYERHQAAFDTAATRMLEQEASFLADIQID